MGNCDFSNLDKLMKLSADSWRVATENNLVDICVKYSNDGPYLESNQKQFINMCSCSYLGWDRNEDILSGAISGIKEARTLHLTTARCRLYLEILERFEVELSHHFGATAIAYNSCAAATSAALPILASGAFTQGIKPLMIFDKFAHFSMGHMKALCADESDVITIENNEITEIEKYCKLYDRVAYISDATYSIRGFASFNELKSLQQQYGLFLYLDDSHGLSVFGEGGRGHAFTNLEPIEDLTIIVASLAKAFGAAGGVLFSNIPEIKTILVRYGNAWSQYLNSAGIGAGLASLALHRSPAIKEAQLLWEQNLAFIDERFQMLNSGQKSPIRVLQLDTPELAVMIATKLLSMGFYTSAVFFPVVPRGKAGIRIMPRADISNEIMAKFCDSISMIYKEFNVT